MSHTPALDVSSLLCPKATAPKAALEAFTEQSFQSAHSPGDESDRGVQIKEQGHFEISVIPRGPHYYKQEKGSLFH